MSDSKLWLARNDPENWDEYIPETDVFNHYTYANTLLKIVQDNTGPLVVGLLCPWGYGKSTILNIFKKRVEKELYCPRLRDARKKVE